MALDLFNGATNLVGQQVLDTLNHGINQLLMLDDDDFGDTLSVQDLHRIIVQDDDYERQMEELEKKLAELEKEKGRERREKEEAERRRQEEEKKKNQENYFQRRWDDVVDDFEHPDHIADNMGKDFEDTVDTLNEDE